VRARLNDEAVLCDDESAADRLTRTAAHSKAKESGRGRRTHLSVAFLPSCRTHQDELLRKSDESRLSRRKVAPGRTCPVVLKIATKRIFASSEQLLVERCAQRQWMRGSVRKGRVVCANGDRQKNIQRLANQAKGEAEENSEKSQRKTDKSEQGEGTDARVHNECTYH
jgi:hypothetical protein